eukprot:11889268-Heterocapsa_arctica.AAC.1
MPTLGNSSVLDGSKRILNKRKPQLKESHTKTGMVMTKRMSRQKQEQKSMATQRRINLRLNKKSSW